MLNGKILLVDDAAFMRMMLKDNVRTGWLYRRDRGGRRCAGSGNVSGGETGSGIYGYYDAE